MIVCISGGGPNCIARIEGRFGSKQYVDLLNEYILPVCSTGPPNRLFVVDNFPVHLSSSIKEWFTTKDKIDYIVLPPKSSDLMPISKLGNAIVDHVNSSVQNDIKNNSDLYKAIVQSFQTICARLSFQNLFIEMSETIKTISESGGH